MKSEPIEEFLRNYLNPPFDVHSPCRAPSEFQWKSISTPNISSQGGPHEEGTNLEIKWEFLRTPS